MVDILLDKFILYLEVDLQVIWKLRIYFNKLILIMVQLLFILDNTITDNEWLEFYNILLDPF